MLLRVEPDSDEPLFAQVADSVRHEAATGCLRPGDRLPPAREVAAALDINMHTVLRAYQDLRDEGLVQLRRGRGAVVTEAAQQLAVLYRGALDLAARADELRLPPNSLVSLVRSAAREHHADSGTDTERNPET